MRGVFTGKLNRPLAVWLLAWLATGMFLPLTAKADPLDGCLKDTTIVVDGQEKTMKYAKAYPSECAAVCYAELSPDKSLKSLGVSCAKCELIAAAAALSFDLDKAKAIGAGIVAYTTTFCAKYLKEGGEQAAKEASCDKGPRGCCISNFKADTDGKGKIDIEECYRKPPIYYGDCYCIAGGAVIPPNENNRGRSTFPACENECDKKGGRVDYTQGIGRYRAESEGVPEQEVDINVMCWRPDDCGYANGVFTGVDAACATGQGYCLAPEPTIQLSSPILGNMQVTGIRGYVDIILRFAVFAAMLASAVMFVYGGFKYILSSSFMEIGTAKETVINSLVGLILTLSCVLLLNTMNPATARYDKLGLKMVNSVKFTTFNWCQDYKPVKPESPLKFGDSGDPPGQLLYSESKLETKAEDTVCGKEYYIEGYTGQRCDGQKCEEKGKICFPCHKGSEIKECGEKIKGNACVKANFAGYITYADERVPKKVELMAVCNWIQPGAGQNFNIKKVKDNTPTFLKATMSGSTQGNAGGVGYVWSGSAADIQKLEDACKKGGGLRGVVIGVVYKDTQKTKGFVAGALVGVGVGAVGGLPGSVVGGMAGGLASSITVDDVAIVTKNDCGNASRFKGYADGTTGYGAAIGQAIVGSSATDERDMQTAFYCGSWIQPGGGVNANLTDLPLPSSMWTLEELKTAVTGDTGITCDFTVTDKNAPSDPGTNLMSKCASGWCPETVQPKCNENK